MQRGILTAANCLIHMLLPSQLSLGQPGPERPPGAAVAGVVGQPARVQDACAGAVLQACGCWRVGRWAGQRDIVASLQLAAPHAPTRRPGAVWVCSPTPGRPGPHLPRRRGVWGAQGDRLRRVWNSVCGQASVVARWREVMSSQRERQHLVSACCLACRHRVIVDQQLGLRRCCCFLQPRRRVFLLSWLCCRLAGWMAATSPSSLLTAATPWTSSATWRTRWRCTRSCRACRATASRAWQPLATRWDGRG